MNHRRVSPYPRNHRLPAAIVGLLTLTATACTPAAITEPELTPSATIAATAPQWGPLDEIRFRITGIHPDAPIEEQLASEIANHRATEELTAACMAEQGFQYVPFLTAAPRLIVVDDSEPLDRDSREFAEQFGFGQSVPVPIGGTMFGSDHGNNPNDAVRAAMSDAELAAWEEALWGVRDADNPFMVLQPGCQAVASEAVRGTVDAFARISDDVDVLLNTVFTGIDPQIAALNTEWAVCMANAGFPGHLSPRLLHQHVFDEWWRVQGVTVTRSEDGLSSSFTGEIQEPTATQLQTFTDWEFALALANYDCRAAIGYHERLNQINFARQQEFVDQHRAELEAWEAYVEQQRDGWVGSQP